jgi:perosamine synthetase
MSAEIRIPVHRPHLDAAETQAVAEVLESRWLGLGAATREFEEKVREVLGVGHVTAVNTGTAALHVACVALGIGPGDEVILPSMTFISTAQAVLAVGARPVFSEVLPGSLTMDMDDVAGLITERTRAIIPVHYGGRLCDMKTLAGLTSRLGIRVIEDAAHAFGTTTGGRAAGSFGDIGCFSFDPIKNITCGGGGAVVSNDSEIAERIRLGHNVGIEVESWARLESKRPWYYQVVAPGLRYYMSNLNASIGLVQLRRMEEYRQRRRAIVARYEDAFLAAPGVTVIPHTAAGVFPFNYVLRVRGQRRDALMDYLRGRGIGTAVQFIPCHLQPVFEAFRRELPVTEQLYEEIVTLPLYHEMTDADVEEVTGAVRRFLGEVGDGE